MTLSITVLGVVQGVGYRPFVARLAEELGITGTVQNNGGIVEITANAQEQAMGDFLRRLKSQQPPGANVTGVLSRPVSEQPFPDFRIVPSGKSSAETPLIPPDLPICENCLREMANPSDRRYRYPFISCVACGPRYSIIDTLPYDRCNITMGDFPMCEACATEYSTNTRRRHAQTISCHDCGPQLILQTPAGVYHTEEALQRGIGMLRGGAVLALKGIGGYQLACSPFDGKAVERLRLFKHRDKKPFAVMFPSAASVKEYCEMNAQEEKLLLSPARPIVLLNKKKDAFCESVSGESRFLGAFLPYTGLHQLLTDECGPLIMTSGNLTNEPILFRDRDMLSIRSEYLDGVLYHQRRILTPLDDSVVRVICGSEQLIRRSRGYVPNPVYLEQTAEKPVLAMGGDMKACFCLMNGGRAYLSQYFGDMEEYRVSQVYRENIGHMLQLFSLKPAVVACDLHPGYQTVRLAEQTGKPLVRIQHHHAHIASVMAEHSLQSCIGVSFDGTGYGTDGAIWGGEFLHCSGSEFRRAAHLNYVTLCGGDRSAKDAELTALCFRYYAGIPAAGGRGELVSAAIENRVNICQSSSMGRLFDAVSAMLNIRKRNTYEGECAIALENAAASALASGESPCPLDFEIFESDGIINLDHKKMIRQIDQAIRSGAEPRRLALGFHRALARAVLAVCRKIREYTGETAVALSGGVFSNRLLTEQCVSELEKDCFQVYLNSAVPCNDQGICLGQAWLCAQKAKPGKQ